MHGGTEMAYLGNKVIFNQLSITAVSGINNYPMSARDMSQLGLKMIGTFNFN
jgi:hypothetical protein